MLSLPTSWDFVKACLRSAHTYTTTTPPTHTNMLCLLMLSAKSYKVGIQNALGLRQTADAPLLGFGPESFPSGEGGEMGRAGSWSLLQRFKGAGGPDARKQRPKT